MKVNFIKFFKEQGCWIEGRGLIPLFFIQDDRRKFIFDNPLGITTIWNNTMVNTVVPYVRNKTGITGFLPYTRATIERTWDPKLKRLGETCIQVCTQLCEKEMNRLCENELKEFVEMQTAFFETIGVKSNMSLVDIEDLILNMEQDLNVKLSIEDAVIDTVVDDEDELELLIAAMLEMELDNE